MLTVSLLIAALIAEGALALIGFHHPIFYRADSLLGTAHLASTDGVYAVEGYADVSINSDGWRDVEHAIPKPPGKIRIAVLGDSYTAAFQVPREETFCAVAESMLETGAQSDVDVLNFGVSGYGPAQELQTLRHHVWKYEPDLVVLAFFSGNDIASGSRAIYGHDVPYFVLEDGSLRLDDSFKDSETLARRDHWAARAFVHATHWSRLAQLVARVRFVQSQRNELEAQKNKKDGATEYGLHNRIYFAPKEAGAEGATEDDAAWREAWAVTEALLLAFRDDCRAQGVPFAVVQLTNPIQVHPDPKRRAELTLSLGIDTLLYPDRRVAGFCRANEIPVLTLAPALQSWAEEHPDVYLHGFEPNLGVGHWNATGHREAGVRIAAWIREAALLPER